ncbi:single-stranded DNA-binding protein [Candidatus Saganbacteria bacterium]|nr:single-stranded DNA-binding protein [Candidatus Saganbacteria bacterium]
MASLNKTMLIGRLTADPETRFTSKENPITRFSIAVERPFKKEGVKEVDFFNCIAWGPLAKICGEYLKKGRLVAVDGRIQISKYKDKEGNNRTSTEIVAEGVQMLDFPKKQKETASV